MMALVENKPNTVAKVNALMPSVLVVTLLLPFILFGCVIGELLFKGSRLNSRGDVKDE